MGVTNHLLTGMIHQPGSTCHSLCLAAAVLKDLSASSYGGRAVWHAHWPAAACLSFSVGVVFFFNRQFPQKLFQAILLYVYIYRMFVDDLDHNGLPKTTTLMAEGGIPSQKTNIPSLKLAASLHLKIDDWKTMKVGPFTIVNSWGSPANDPRSV